jgi:chromosome segregation ATPase
MGHVFPATSSDRAFNVAAGELRNIDDAFPLSADDIQNQGDRRFRLEAAAQGATGDVFEARTRVKRTPVDHIISQNGKISVCSAELEKANSQIATLNSAAADAVKQITDLTVQLTAANDQIANLQTKLADKPTTVDDPVTNAVLMQGTNVRSTDEVQRLNAQIADLTKKLADAESRTVPASSADLDAAKKAKEAAEKALKEAEDSSHKKMWIAIIVSSVVFVLSGVGAFFWLRARV